MNMAQEQIRIGLSRNQSCSYLPNKQERVAVVLEKHCHDANNYEMLLANGFRRSGDTIYKPQCDFCQACQALRVSIQDFQPTKSQKRLLNKAKSLRWEVKDSLDDDWFELYQRYIEVRHAKGSMFPPNQQQFFDFSQCKWLNIKYLHIYENDVLISIAITDNLPNSASAFYTFYEPKHPLSLGTLSVLKQIEYCRIAGKQWLYLGYQIDECSAMNYKTNFHRHQRLVNQRWRG